MRYFNFGKKSISNMLYMFGELWQINHKQVIYYFINILLDILSPLVTIIMPQYIVNALTSNTANFEIIWKLCILFGISWGTIGILQCIFGTLEGIGGSQFFLLMRGKLAKQVMALDLANFDDPEMYRKYELATQSSDKGVIEFDIDFKRYLTSTLILCETIMLIGSVSVLGSCILVAIIGLNVVYQYHEQKKIEKLEAGTVDYERKYSYYNKLATDYLCAKEVRVYSLREIIIKRIQNNRKKYYENIYDIISIKENTIGVVACIQYILLGILLILFVVCYYKNIIMLGSLVMFITTCKKFCEELHEFCVAGFKLVQDNTEIERYRDFMELKSEIQNYRIEPFATVSDIKNVEIRFEHVSFKYPNSDKYTLRDIDFTIHEGEKVLLVGENGAGKTTLIKLLTRLYDPTEGRILIDNVDIRCFTYDEYNRLLATIFQDYKMFSFTVRENVTFEKEYDDEKVMEVLKEVGLEGKISSLEKGMDTYLYRNYVDAGVELSGGEAQKLAIARALVRDGRIVILDEPTSALDPIAETQIYKDIYKLLGNKTGVFVSHRMSSATVVDKVICMENGEIVEIGTHGELMQMQGIYYELFNLQAQYYRSVDDEKLS